MTGMPLLGEHVRDLVSLGAVVDHEPVAELVREPDRGRDVVVAVGVLVPHELAVEDARERLVGEVALERLALRRLPRPRLLGVVLSARRTPRGGPRLLRGGCAGVCFLSPYTRLGFSPSADLTGVGG